MVNVPSCKGAAELLNMRITAFIRDTPQLSISAFVLDPLALRLSVPTHVDFSHKVTSAPIIAPIITIPMSAHTNVLLPWVGGAFDLVELLAGPQVAVTPTIPGAEAKQFMAVLLAKSAAVILQY